MAELLDIAEQVLGWARDGEQVEVYATHERETDVRVYEAEVESFSSAESQGVGVRVIANGRQGFAWAGTLDTDVLAQTLVDARDNAVFGTPDEYLGLAEPDGVEPAGLALYDEALLSFATEKKIDLTLELERLTRAADTRIIGIESAEYVDAVHEYAIVSTAGVCRTARETGCYISAYVLASDGTDTQSGFGWSVGRAPGALEVERCASEAAARATRLLGATKPKTGRVTVVLTPWVTAQFLGILGSTLSGEAVLKGRSLFADRLGDEVASPNITLLDDPTRLEAFTATAVDAEGLATRRNVLIGDGRVKQFLHNAYTARRSGTVSTGSAVRSGFKSTPGVGSMSLQLVPGTKSQESMIAGMDNGLLVQEVSGLHSGVNTVSGDFSTGAEGLMIRNGALAEPVRELTIASTIQKMLRDITAVGADVEWLPMGAVGVSLVVDDLTMSGT